MALRDVTKLTFKRGTLDYGKHDQENSYISLWRRALNYFYTSPVATLTGTEKIQQHRQQELLFLIPL